MSEAPPQAESAGRPRRRRRRWPWVTLGLLVALVAGLRVALPTLVERGAAYGSRYWLGLPARIDNVDFALFDGIVVLEGVSVGADPDAVEPIDAAFEPPTLDEAVALLHFDRISAHLSWKELREGTVRVSDLVLEAPAIRVLREDDGAIDPMRHARPLAPAADAEPPAEVEEPGEPWTVAVDRFTLTTPNVVVMDPPTGQSLLEFSLEKFALENVSSHAGRFALGGVGIEGPVLRVRRDLVLASPKAKADAAPPAAPAAPSAAAPPAPDTATAAPAAAPPAPDTATDSAGAAPPAAPATPAPATPATPAAAPAPAPNPTGFRVEKIDIARATFTWVTDRGPLDVALALKASDITADEGKRFPIDLQLEIESGRIALAGDVGILPPSYTGKLTWSGLPFPPLLLASLPDLAAWLRSADSSGDLVIDADVAGVKGAPALRLSGRTAVATLDIGDPGNKEVALGWKQLEVVMKDVVVPLPETGKPARTTVANFELVRLTEPKIRYTHPSPALNALLGIQPAPAVAADAAPAKDARTAPAKAAATAKKAATPAKPPASATPAPGAVVQAGGDAVAPSSQDAATPVDVTVALLELLAGDLEVIDTTVTPPVASTVKELFVSARDVHFPDPSANAVSVRAVLPKASALTVEGSLRAGNNGDFTISLQKLDLPMFSPYASAAGASLDAGQASVKTRLKMRGATMQVDNDLVLRKLGVSLRDPSTFDRSFGMPIDLALALLRDPAGDIRLTIPVRIDEKGAQVSMGAIIASALKAALIGAMTAPLKMLGAAFGGGEGESAGLAIAPVAGTAGVAEPASDAGSRADGLAKLLSQRPAMGLLLRGRVGPEDRPVVAEQILVERLKAGDGLPDLEGSGFLARRRISQALLARDPGASEKKKKEAEPLSPEDQGLFDRYIAAVEIPAARLDALATARAGKVRELLLARKADPKKVDVGAREADGVPGVVISLQAK